MSVKKFAGNLFVGTVAAVSILSTAAAAPSLVINDGAPVSIKMPPGFSYAANASGTASILDVTTDGFVFCANVNAGTVPPSTIVTMEPQHLGWTLPVAGDIRGVSYTDGVLAVNKGAGNFTPETTLNCQMRGQVGEIATPFSGFGDFLFRDGLDSFVEVQYSNLVNWLPVPDFSWDNPDWSKVPNDSCTWDQDPNSPAIAENTLCAAAAGVRQIAPNSTNDARYGDRAATMWTKSTSTRFIYLARIDSRFGPQQGVPNANFPAGTPQQVGQTSSVDIALRDGYDSDYLSAAGTYCLLRELPATLTDNVCSDPAVYYSDSVNGNLSERITLDTAWAKAKSLFVVVVRTKSNDPDDQPPINTPVAAIAAISDPGVSRNEGGDEFIGDNVVFGFPEGQGFPWMGGQ